LRGYIQLAQRLLTHDARYATAYNFGPSEDDAKPVHWIAQHMTGLWADGASWVRDTSPKPHEAGYLKLDTSRARADLDWAPSLRLEMALDYLVSWYKNWDAKADMHIFTLDQIERYCRFLE
jgi:CDP-glucose 4,6-dehydratase